MIHFTSDTHWGHKNIIKYSNRPFSSVEEMDETLINNWNAVVKPNDIVWHLGDFAFCDYKSFTQILRRLNGTKNVILGNHDKIITNNWDNLIDSKLLSSIQYYKELKADGQMIVLLHYPIASWNKKHHGAIHLHGHCHASFVAPGKIVDVGVDDKRITSEYRPISIIDIIKYMKNIPDVAVDHHFNRE